MSNQIERIEGLLIDNPEWRKRKFRYILASEMTGVSPEKCKEIASILDQYRHQTDVDKKGLELEKEWKRSPELAQENDNWDKIFRIIAN